MATIPQIEPKTRSNEELAVELFNLVEEHFDEQGLNETERQARYDALERSLNARDAARAKT